eukprot:4923054-Amphidinium_carterae.2
MPETLLLSIAGRSLPTPQSPSPFVQGRVSQQTKTPLPLASMEIALDKVRHTLPPTQIIEMLLLRNRHPENSALQKDRETQQRATSTTLTKQDLTCL